MVVVLWVLYTYYLVFALSVNGLSSSQKHLGVIVWAGLTGVAVGEVFLHIVR